MGEIEVGGKDLSENVFVAEADCGESRSRQVVVRLEEHLMDYQ